MQTIISYTDLLDYILNRFLVVFAICFIGSLVKDIYDTYINFSPISIKRITISSMFAAVVLCAGFEYFEVSIALFVLICFFSGIWSFKILEAMMNWEVVKILLKHIFKNTKTIIGNAVSETMEDLDKTSEENKALDANNKDKKDESVP